MNGTGPICLRLANHGYHEHPSIESARREACRLACTFGSDVVVYVPVLRVSPPTATAVERVPLPDDAQRELDLEQGDGIPF